MAYGISCIYAPIPIESRRLITYSRSEEHTSDLQSPCNLVCRLLLDMPSPSLRLTLCPYTTLFRSIFCWEGNDIVEDVRVVATAQLERVGQRMRAEPVGEFKTHGIWDQLYIRAHSHRISPIDHVLKIGRAHV